jgi:hypothetical protein
VAGAIYDPASARKQLSVVSVKRTASLLVCQFGADPAGMIEYKRPVLHDEEKGGAG